MIYEVRVLIEESPSGKWRARAAWKNKPAGPDQWFTVEMTWDKLAQGKMNDESWVRGMLSRVIRQL